MKNWDTKQFIGYLFLLSIALYGVLFFIFTKVMPAPGVPLYYMIPILFVFTALAYIILVRTKDKNPRQFVYSYMLISMGRLLMYGGFVFIYALSHRENAREFAVTFFLLYLVYTIFEIKAVLSYFKS